MATFAMTIEPVTKAAITNEKTSANGFVKPFILVFPSF
jgi:hypothetical protein